MSLLIKSLSKLCLVLGVLLAISGFFNNAAHMPSDSGFYALGMVLCVVALIQIARKA